MSRPLFSIDPVREYARRQAHRAPTSDVSLEVGARVRFVGGEALTGIPGGTELEVEAVEEKSAQGGRPYRLCRVTHKGREHWLLPSQLEELEDD